MQNAPDLQGHVFNYDAKAIKGSYIIMSIALTLMTCNGGRI
jgi:hypothetical protein